MSRRKSIYKAFASEMNTQQAQLVAC